MRPMPRILEKEEKGSDGEKDNELSEPSDDEQEEEVNQEWVSDHATTFTAEVHAEFFRNVMKKYKVILEEWAFCQVKFIFALSFYNSHYFRLQTVAIQTSRWLDCWECRTYHATIIC